MQKFNFSAFDLLGSEGGVCVCGGVGMIHDRRIEDRIEDRGDEVEKIFNHTTSWYSTKYLVPGILPGRLLLDLRSRIVQKKMNQSQKQV